MGKNGHIKKLLPGGNTSIGFYSYFQYLIDPKEAKKIYYIKGGSGVGKSYMMKKIGYDLVESGIDVEFHHCSAEPDSIDAIVIPSIKVVLLDGTSPHMDDPRYPGVTGVTVNLGEFINEEEVRKNKEHIIAAVESNKNIYIRIYKYLAAAKLIHDDIEWIHGYAMDFNEVNKEASNLIEKYLMDIPVKNRIGKERHLFGSAYTLKGNIDFAETYIGTAEKVIYIEGEDGTGKSTLLEKLMNVTIAKGHDVEVYHEPLVPQKIETVVIPALSLAFTTNHKFAHGEEIDLNQYINKEKLHQYEEELAHSKEAFEQLMDHVYKNLYKTNVVHDEIEKYYVPNVAHEGANKIRERILEEIYSFIKEVQS